MTEISWKTVMSEVTKQWFNTEAALLRWFVMQVTFKQTGLEKIRN